MNRRLTDSDSRTLMQSALTIAGPPRSGGETRTREVLAQRGEQQVALSCVVPLQRLEVLVRDECLSRAESPEPDVLQTDHPRSGLRVVGTLQVRSEWPINDVRLLIYQLSKRCDSPPVGEFAG